MGVITAHRSVSWSRLVSRSSNEMASDPMSPSEPAEDELLEYVPCDSYHSGGWFPGVASDALEERALRSLVLNTFVVGERVRGDGPTRTDGFQPTKAVAEADWPLRSLDQLQQTRVRVFLRAASSTTDEVGEAQESCFGRYEPDLNESSATAKVVQDSFIHRDPSSTWPQACHEGPSGSSKRGALPVEDPRPDVAGALCGLASHHEAVELGGAIAVVPQLSCVRRLSRVAPDAHATHPRPAVDPETVAADLVHQLNPAHRVERDERLSGGVVLRAHPWMERASEAVFPEPIGAVAVEVGRDASDVRVPACPFAGGEVWIVQHDDSPDNTVLGVFATDDEAYAFMDTVKDDHENGAICPSFSIPYRSTDGAVRYQAMD